MANVSKPNTFTANTTISSSQVNDNFDTIYNEFNGNISGANLAAGAVTSSKIANSVSLTDVEVTGGLTANNNIDMVDGKAIRDGNDNELIKVSQTASAVNELTVKNAATGNPPEIQATGGDTNISLKLVPKGSGSVIMPNPYKFRVYRNSAWTGSASYAKVQFDSEDFDSNSNFDSTTNYRYTAPVTGFYLFSARASNAQTGTGDTAIALYVNGSLHTTGALYAHTVNFDYSAEVTGLISLTASDYVEVYFKGGGTGRTGNKDTYFCGYLVSQT